MTARGTALVTGAGRRIGAAIAAALGASGWHVVLHHNRAAPGAQAVAAAIRAAGGSAETMAADLGEDDEVMALADRVAAARPDWRLLVNNAARFEPDTPGTIDPGVWDRAMAVNARAPARLSSAFVGRTGGPRRILTILDQKLANPNPDFASYTASKAALAEITRLQAMAWTDADVRVYGIAPGMMLPSIDQNPVEFRNAARMNLLGRRTRLGELTALALTLTEADFTTGQCFFLDSGQHLLPLPRDVLYLAREG
jgi:NAD(P)-dependent dehydrogenase (short-subunit alcohol dehydrogenase family)